MTVDALKKRYADTVSIEASIDQVKESKWLVKPLASQVQLSVKDGAARWRTLTPVDSTVVLDGSGLTTLDAKGQKTRTAMPQSEGVAALMRIVRALLTVDLPALERDFTLEPQESGLRATPKAGAQVAGLKELSFTFDPELNLKQLVIVAEGEKTTLAFTSLTTKKKGS